MNDSNMVLSEVIEVNQEVILTTPVTSLNKKHQEINALLGKKFIFEGTIKVGAYPKPSFKSLDTGKSYFISASAFLCSSRYEAKGVRSKNTDAKVIYITSPGQISDFVTGKPLSVRAGTIFNTYRKNPDAPSSMIVTSDSGREFSIPNHMYATIVDLEGEPPVIEVIESVKETEQKPEVPVQVLTPEIEEITMYIVQGITFATRQEAEAALVMYKAMQQMSN